MTNKETLMKRLQMYDFILTETNLFLNTHPNNKQALAYFNKYLAIRKEVAMEYTEKYGTICTLDLQSDNKWDWVDSPWPWENEEE